MKNIIIIFFCMSMLMFQATAQNHADVKEIEVSGIVLDSNKDPLIGANIVVKNVPGLGVITNIDGKFKIKVELYQRLIVSYIGFESQEILIKDKKTLTVIMQESKSSVLDEVVITGTGEQKKITVTGAVSSANITHLNVSPSGNLVNALAGNVPGVLSMQSSGAPGQNTSEFWIRGISTFGAKTSALVLVDGFERDMDDISIEDIESFQVLKDASETAIYGARGANGVVLITTKHGKPSKITISAKAETSYNTRTITPEFIDGPTYASLINEARITRNEEPVYQPDELYILKNGLDPDLLPNVDWMDEILKKGAMTYKASLNITGGSTNTRYFVSASYVEEEGMYKTDKEIEKQYNTNANARRWNYRMNADIDITKSTLLNVGISGMLKKVNDTGRGSSLVWNSLMGQTPVSIPKVYSNGYFPASEYNENYRDNPWIASTQTGYRQNWTNQIQTNVTLNQKLDFITEGLKFIGRLGLSKTLNAREDFYPASHTRFLGYSEDKFFEKGTYSKLEGESSNVNMDITANYSLLSDKHQLFLNLNYKMEQSRSEKVTFTMVGFPNDKNGFITSGLGFNKSDYPPVGNESISREIGVLSALNYSYDDRYLADLSWRASASSRFGQDKRWGQFWSAGIGWNFHKEHFMEQAEWLKQFKLRASTGYTGAQNFNPYQALAMFSYNQTQAYDNWIGSHLMALPNDDLKWQKTQDYNIGFDLNLWGRLMIVYDYYVQQTKDQLLALTVPPSMGFTSYMENIGSTENKGMELKLNAHLLYDVENDRYLSTSFSIAKNTNKLKKISNALRSYNDEVDNEILDGNTNRPQTRFIEGSSMNAIWAVRSLGIDPATGDEIFLTKDGETTTEWKAEDQVVCGDAMPECSGTFGINMDYRGIFLNMSFYYQFGGQTYNQTLVDRVENADAGLNVDKRIYNAVWKKPGDRVDFSYNPYRLTKPSSRFVQDLNELRLSSLNVGYDFRHCAFLKKSRLQQLKASFYMDDVFRASTVKTERGLTYPFARTFSFSLQATF